MAARSALAGAAGLLLFCVAPIACTLVFPVRAVPDSEGEAGSDASTEAAAPGDGASEAAPATSYRDAVLADDPVAYLRFGEANGPTAADEMNAFVGTYPVAGVGFGAAGALANDSDKAITFDGTSGVTMPPGLDFAGDAPFSLEVWVKQTDYAGAGLTLDHEEHPIRDGWVLRFGSDKFGVERWRDGQTNGSAQLSEGPLPLGSYHHVVATFDGTNLRLYRDGEPLPVQTPQGSSPLKVLGKPWTVGKQNCCDGVAFVGSLDELAIYAHALTAEKIARHYAIGTGRDAGSP